MNLAPKLRPCLAAAFPAGPIPSSSIFSPLSLFVRMNSTTKSSHPDLSGTPTQPLLPSYLVTPQALSTALRKNVYTKISTAPRIIPLCATWFMPNDPQSRTGLGSYLAGHVPRARFFDLDKICDKDSPYPHMLPTPEVFAQAMGKLGIHKDDAVVVYDDAEQGIGCAHPQQLQALGRSGVSHREG